MFDTSVKLSQPLTHAVENFRHSVNEMGAEGDTALWDALALANDQLSEHGEKFPEAKRRIICLSDGVDNKSSNRVQEVANNIFVCTPIKRQATCASETELIYAIAKQSSGRLYMFGG